MVKAVGWCNSRRINCSDMFSEISFEDSAAVLDDRKIDVAAKIPMAIVVIFCIISSLNRVCSAPPSERESNVKGVKNASK